MNKEEFEKKLREKLNLLETSEINDIIEEYMGYINEKIENGATEEEAIKDFGDLDELARELLKAYKINVERPTKEKNILNTIADTFLLWMERFIKLFSNKSGKEVLRIIIELGIILLIISCCRIPFYFLENIGFDMFSIFQNQLGMGLFRIWKFLLELIYLISAVVLFAKIFEKRYLNDLVIEEQKDMTKPKEKKSVKKDDKVIEERQKKGIIDLLTTMCIWFIKFIAFWILFGVGCYILGLATCLGVCVYFLIRGVIYYGIYLAILMLLILGILTFIILFNFITNKKNNLNFLLISFLSCFVLLGISFSASSLEIASIEFINETPQFYQKEIVTETISMSEDYFIHHFVNFEVDDNLTSEIKFEYIYFKDYYKIKPNIKINDNGIYVNYSFTNHNWNLKMIDEIIENLKDHKLYNYDLSPKITVYTSSKNIEKLKENYQKYKNQTKYENNRYHFCKSILIEEDTESELYDYCENIINKKEENW